MTNPAGRTSALKSLLGAGQLRGCCRLDGDCRADTKHWAVTEKASAFDHLVAMTAVEFLRGSDGAFIHRVVVQIEIGWKDCLGGGASFGLDIGFDCVGWFLRYGGCADGDGHGHGLAALDYGR